MENPFQSRLIEIIDAAQARISKETPGEASLELKALSVTLFQLELCKILRMNSPEYKMLRREFKSMILTLGGPELHAESERIADLFLADAKRIARDYD